MDIAAAATVMSRTALSQAVGLRVLNMAKSQAETQGQNLVQMLGQSNGNPNLGNNLDIKV